MSGDLSSLSLSMVNEEDLRVQVAATIASRSDQAAVNDQARVAVAWKALQDQETAVSALEAAVDEAKRAQAAPGLTVVGVVRNDDTKGAPLSELSLPQLEFRLTQARRELMRAGTALDAEQKRADERQKARYESARQRELVDAQADRQRWTPATTAQTAFAGHRGGVPVRAGPTSAMARPASVPAAVPVRTSPSPSHRSSVVMAPDRRPLTHLRGITREAYTGGDILPSLTRVHVSRADIRAKRLRYADDADEVVYHARVLKRRRLELIAALQAYTQHMLARKTEEAVVKKEETISPVRVKAEPGVAASRAVKREVSASPSLSPALSSLPTHRRLSADGHEVIDVDALMEEQETEAEVGSPQLHELLAVLDAVNADESEDKVQTTYHDGEGTEKKVGAAAGVATTRKRARTTRNTDDDDAKSAALWARAESIVASNPELPINQDVEVIPGIRMARSVYDNLLDYQQEGLRWMLHLHGQRYGGILGDEMGLGKTVQVAALLNALHASNQLRGPALIIAPMTVLRQWVAEMHRWAPYVRSCVMHESVGDHSPQSRESLLRSVQGTPSVVITTYAALRTHCELLHNTGFQYLIVDEGHKLSNPEAAVTLAAKSFPTPHRLVLSGSPIQNSLKELWCLFDLVRPGLLGTMNKFVDEFEAPISQSKNVRASPLALQTAMECAKTLQTHIAPFLLRRLKRHVNASLPPKVERVIRVPLTDEQLAQYVEIVSSPTVQRLFSQTLYYPQIDGGPLSRDNRDSSGSLHVAGRRFNLKDARRRNTSGVRLESFRVMNQLRQVCNHTDIYAVRKGEHDEESDEVKAVRHTTLATKTARAAEARSFRSNNLVNMNGSAKLCALQQMLREWQRFGHRVLVFSQTRMMLDIIENLCEQENYRYIRMDGTTGSHYRQELIDRFNSDDSIFVALLTTRVGGIGVNLVGADRVVIFDPDWNPVTDIQARERAWRIGQLREVCVYRMISTGTVEEAILRRQLAKTYVTDKVLRDPTLQRFFQVQDSFAENFLLGQEYADRVPVGKKHVLGGVYGDTMSSRGAGGAGQAAGQAARRARATSALYANGAGGEQEQALLRDDVNISPTPSASSPTAAAPVAAGVRRQGVLPDTEAEFGVVVHVSHGGAEEEAETETETADSGATARDDGGETSLLKKLMDGQDVDIDGKDVVARRLARVRARTMMQRVAEDGQTRSAEVQRREFSLLWAAQQKKEKEMADRAEQRRYFEEDMARKRQGK